MLQIGSAWHKFNQETGKNSISISLSEEILKIYPTLQGMYFNLYENKDKKEDKHPDYFLYLSLPKKEDNKKF